MQIYMGKFTRITQKTRVKSECTGLATNMVTITDKHRGQYCSTFY